MNIDKKKNRAETAIGTFLFYFNNVSLCVFVCITERVL